MYAAVTRRGCATAKEDHVGGRQLHCSLNPNYGNSGKYGKITGQTVSLQVGALLLCVDEV